MIKQQFGSKAVSQIEGCKNWEEVASHEASYNQKNPFINAYPFVVEQVKPVRFNNEWWLQDAAKKMMKISDGFTNIWKLLSISGGAPLSLAITGKENNYTPMGAWHQGSYKLL